MTPRLTVVVPVRDDLRIVRCLSSIDAPGADTLVVMNDASREVKRAVSEAGAPSINLTDVGAPAACEVGIERAETDSVLMMDSDCVFLPGTLAKFVDKIDAAPVVRGMTVFRHHTKEERVVARVRARHTNAPSQTYKVPLMIDRKIRERIGGYVFDPRLPWTEDFDLGVRLEKAGIRALRLRDAVVVHDALDVRTDLSSARKYGQGHRVGCELGLDGYVRPRAAQLGRGAWGALRKYGAADTAFGLAWNINMYLGYHLKGH